MGRGRQKAKQTKVARELKYFSPDTNYRALEQELTSRSRNDVVTDSRRSAVDTDDDPSLWERWSSGDDER